MKFSAAEPEGENGKELSSASSVKPNSQPTESDKKINKEIPLELELETFCVVTYFTIFVNY